MADNPEVLGGYHGELVEISTVSNEEITFPTTKIYKLIESNFSKLNHNHTSNNVTDLIDVIYPVGSIYMSVNNVDPSTLFGGSWEKLQGRFIVGAGTYTDKNNVSKTFNVNDADTGEYNHTLSVNEMPSHNHSLNRNFSTGSSGGGTNAYVTTSNRNAAVPDTGSRGGGQAHNNIPPYIVVNIWKRLS